MDNFQNTIFISYRRSTSNYFARLLFEKLRKYGFDVFLDIESIKSGDFSNIILSQIASRAHFLIILAPGTVDFFSEPQDWMRREIEYAIEMERNIIPILADGFDFSKHWSNQIPNKIRALSNYNSISIYSEYFDEAVDRLVNGLLKLPVSSNIQNIEDNNVINIQEEFLLTSPLPTENEIEAEKFFNTAISKLHEKDYSSAIRYSDLAIKRKDDYSNAYTTRGTANYWLGNYSEAITDFSAALHFSSSDSDALNYRALAFEAIGQYDEAIENYEQSIQINPSEASTFLNLSMLYISLNQYTKALSLIEKAIEIDPKSPEAYYNKGIILLEIDSLHEALQCFNSAIKLNPGVANFYLQRGQLFEKLDMLTEALKDINKAIVLNPNDTQSKDIRVRIQKSLRGKND